MSVLREKKGYFSIIIIIIIRFLLIKDGTKNQLIDLKGEKVKEIFRQCFFLRNFLNNEGGEKEKK